jgi:hypothetical protein
MDKFQKKVNLCKSQQNKCKFVPDLEIGFLI